MKIQIRNSNFKPKTKNVIQYLDQLFSSYNLVWTVRQVHYHLVEKNLIPNTRQGYRKASRWVTDGRYSGLIDWDKIADDTRGVIKTPDYESIEDGISTFLNSFRLSGRWKNKNYRVEVWVEKRTLRRLFEPITDKYDVYLQVGTGFNSTTAIWDAIRRISEYNTEKLYILYFGDLDPSGDYMDKDIKKRLTEFKNSGIYFKDKTGKEYHIPSIFVNRLLVDYEDIEKYNLKPKFSVPIIKNGIIKDKIKEDPRARRFYELYSELFQVELEALTPKQLTDVLETKLKIYADSKQMELVPKEEEKEINRIKEKIGI